MKTKHFFKAKHWLAMVLMTTIMGLALFALPTIILDPLFHYHAPLKGWEYNINNERYQNDGIVKHFAYDSIITGTSMTQNFKASQFDTLWNARTIKVPFSGGGYKEIGENLQRAIASNKNIRNIVWGLDSNQLNFDKDWARYDVFPTYLYDCNPFNDVEYILNKENLLNFTYLNVIRFTLTGRRTPSFDDYKNWMAGRTFGKEAVLGTYHRDTKSKEQAAFSNEHRIMIQGTLDQNVLPLIRENPQITFYIFYPPYSICFWDSTVSAGNLEVYLRTLQYASECLLAYDNVRLFSFFDDYNLICDLNNYNDTVHYHEDINTKMLIWMHEGEHRLTRDTYKQHFSELRAFYSSYDYDSALSLD